MFGLTVEKLLVIAVLAAVVVGPARLPEYARRLSAWVRTLRDAIESARATAQSQADLAGIHADWEALDPRRYDPRRIVREALRESPVDSAGRPAAAAEDDGIAQEAARIRPGQRYLVTGSAAHPCRIRIDSLPAGDPRRIAAATGGAVRTDGADTGGSDTGGAGTVGSGTAGAASPAPGDPAPETPPTETRAVETPAAPAVAGADHTG